MKRIDRYQLEEIVGSGTYGKVYKSKMVETGELFAIKCIPVEKFRKIRKLNEFTQNEIEVLERITHPNIVKFYEKLVTVNNTYMVYEFCNNGTLESKIYTKSFLSEEDSLRYFSEIISAMVYLDDMKILHRDIKPANIMLNDNTIKIGDFGFCKPVENVAFTQTMVGSPIYMAPEILKNENYDSKADVWSLGVVLYEMFFGKCPYEERTIPRLMALFETRPLKIPREINNISLNSEKLIRGMLVVDPNRRTTFREAQNILCSFYPYALQLQKQFNNYDGEKLADMIPQNRAQTSTPQSNPQIQTGGIQVFNKPNGLISQNLANIQQFNGQRITQEGNGRPGVSHSNSRNKIETNVIQNPQITGQNYQLNQNQYGGKFPSPLDYKLTPNVSPQILNFSKQNSGSQKNTPNISFQEQFNPNGFKQVILPLENNPINHQQLQQPIQSNTITSQPQNTSYQNQPKINFLKLNDYRTVISPPNIKNDVNQNGLIPQITNSQNQYVSSQKFVIQNDRIETTPVKIETLKADQKFVENNSEKVINFTQMSTPLNINNMNINMNSLNQPPIRTFAIKNSDSFAKDIQKVFPEESRIDLLNQGSKIQQEMPSLEKKIEQINKELNYLNQENIKSDQLNNSQKQIAEIMNMSKNNEAQISNKQVDFQTSENQAIQNKLLIEKLLQQNTSSQKISNSVNSKPIPVKVKEDYPIPPFLIKLSQKFPKSDASNELIRLNGHYKNQEEINNEVQNVLNKRSKFLILFNFVKFIWSLEMEEIEETKLFCVMLILKKINYYILEIKISLSSYSNTFLSRFITDVEHFRLTIKHEIDAFCSFFEAFMANLHEFLRSSENDYLRVRQEAENYDFNDQFFKTELLKMIISMKKHEKSIDSMQLELYVASVIDCVFVDEIMNTYGHVTGEIEKYWYNDLIQKIPTEELVIMNGEKFRIAAG